MALLVFNVYIGKSNPKIESAISVPVLEGSVVVNRDEEGVPHIEAQTDANLHRA